MLVTYKEFSPTRQVSMQASCHLRLTRGLIAIFLFLILMKWILHVSWHDRSRAFLIFIDYCCGKLRHKSGHFHNSHFKGVFRSGTFDRGAHVEVICFPPTQRLSSSFYFLGKGVPDSTSPSGKSGIRWSHG